jgi:hypothetical protein
MMVGRRNLSSLSEKVFEDMENGLGKLEAIS